MSKQRKNEKQRALAKTTTALHLQGKRGPAKTVAKHGKKYENTLKYKKDVAARAAKARAVEEE